MKVTYVDHMGTDLSVVNAARVSFNKKSDWQYSQGGTGPVALRPNDIGLIHFLARGCTFNDWNEIIDQVFISCEQGDAQEIEEILNHMRSMPSHWTPFGHTAITLHIKAPLFVARQLGKHQVGMVWNEVSRRYVTDEPEFFQPEGPDRMHGWRKAAANVKQGSSDEIVDFSVHAQHISHGYIEDALRNYKDMLEEGVCPEQARMLLPQSMYTEWYWTGNLQGFANVYNLRTDSYTQKETQDVARQIGEIIEPLYPVSWKALTQGEESAR